MVIGGETSNAWYSLSSKLCQAIHAHVVRQLLVFRKYVNTLESCDPYVATAEWRKYAICSGQLGQL